MLYFARSLLLGPVEVAGPQLRIFQSLLVGSNCSLSRVSSYRRNDRQGEVGDSLRHCVFTREGTRYNLEANQSKIVIFKTIVLSSKTGYSTDDEIIVLAWEIRRDYIWRPASQTLGRGIVGGCNPRRGGSCHGVRASHLHSVHSIFLVVVLVVVRIGHHSYPVDVIPCGTHGGWLKPVSTCLCIQIEWPLSWPVSCMAGYEPKWLDSSVPIIGIDVSRISTCICTQSYSASVSIRPAIIWCSQFTCVLPAKPRYSIR